MTLPHLPTRLEIVDTTLREGEQFSHAFFTPEARTELVLALDAFGVQRIELTSPAASPGAAAELRRIAKLGLRAKILTHTRCTPEDVNLALDCGADGVNLLFGTSELLRTHSHNKSLAQIADAGAACVELIHAAGREARFSCEDAFRTPLDQLLPIYAALDATGVDRVGIADTVGIAAPEDVTRVVTAIRNHVHCELEFHGHDDTGCAIANARAAFRAGANHLDTTLLRIGERNGIASLSGVIARLFADDPASVAHFDLARLVELDTTAACLLGLPIPFKAPITSPTAFHHKAGLHTNAVLSEPASYEVLPPERFGATRKILLTHSLVGRHAITSRAAQLGIQLDREAGAHLTAQVKARADSGDFTAHELDAMIRAYALARC